MKRNVQILRKSGKRENLFHEDNGCLIHTTDETEQAIKEQIAAGKALEVFDVTSIT